MDLLGKGLELESDPGGSQIRIFLRLPDGRQSRKDLFKDIVSDSTIRESVNFTERYFRDRGSHFFHSHLERTLKKNFGFRFEYKIVIEPTRES